MRCRGFTLIEICLAVFIALMLITVAVPSIQRVLNQENDQQSFERFDALVRYAQGQAVSERRNYVLVWNKTGVSVRPEKAANRGEAAGHDHFEIGEKEGCDIYFPAALVKKPSRKWIFWPSGTCEPATISYKGEKESWMAEYDPLTAQATVTTDEKE